MDADIDTNKTKDVEAALPLWVGDDSLARALEGLTQAMDNARAELERRDERAGHLTLSGAIPSIG